MPQPPLIEAINTLPTFQDWLDADWMKSPVALTHRGAKTLKKVKCEAGEQALEAWKLRRVA